MQHRKDHTPGVPLQKVTAAEMQKPLLLTPISKPEMQKPSLLMPISKPLLVCSHRT
jgi:hypothetical protein